MGAQRDSRKRAYAGAALLLLAVPAIMAGENPRWDFLRLNLDLFPGAEKIFAPDERLFWRLKSNLRNIRAAEKLPDKEYRFRVSTDARGRRVTPPAAEDARTVLFLGDSCTFGIPVNDEEAIPARVQREIPESRALNAGVPGYSAFQGRLLLEDLLPTVQPTAVVITFWMNGGSIWDHLSDAEHQELLAAERKGEFSRHRLTRLLRRATPGGRPRLSEEEFATEIRAMIAMCRDGGAKPIVTIWPHRNQMSEPVKIPRQEILRRVAAEEGAALADLVPAFRRHPPEEMFTDPVHATPQGYALAASALVPSIRKALETTEQP